MTLKCIGGPNDGEYRKTYDKRYGDLIAIQQLAQLSSIDINISAISRTVEMKVEFYKVERICWRQDGKSKEWSFLLHEKLTILDVFDKLFT